MKSLAATRKTLGRCSSLSAKLDGYLRSENRGAAGLRVADAAVHPAGGGPAVWLAFPPCQTSSDGMQRCEREAEPTSLTLPAGHYVLVANLVIETTTGGFLRSHAEAIFSPGRREGSWSLEGCRPP